MIAFVLKLNNLISGNPLKDAPKSEISFVSCVAEAIAKGQTESELRAIVSDCDLKAEHHKFYNKFNLSF